MEKGHVADPSDLVSVVEEAMKEEGPLCPQLRPPRMELDDSHLLGLKDTGVFSGSWPDT